MVAEREVALRRRRPRVFTSTGGGGIDIALARRIGLRRAWRGWRGWMPCIPGSGVGRGMGVLRVPGMPAVLRTLLAP